MPSVRVNAKDRLRHSGLAFLACGALLVDLGACTHHSLGVARTDGSSSDVAPAVEETAGPMPQADVGPDAGMEGGTEAGLEVARETIRETGQPLGDFEVREAGFDRDAEDAPVASLEVYRETPSGIERDDAREAGSAKCATAPTSARTVAQWDGGIHTTGLIVRGDTAFLGVFTEQNPADPSRSLPTGAIVAVSVSTGAKATFPLGAAIPSRIVAGPGAIFYIQGKVTQVSDGWRVDYTEVARLDLASGQVSVVASGAPGLYLSVDSLVATATGEVFWSKVLDANGRSSIERWDETTYAAQEVFTWGQSMPLLADQDHFYWSRLTSALYVDFLSMPMAGGTVSQIYQSTSPFPDSPSLSAVDEQNIYYLFSRGASAGIWSMPKGGGEGHAVLPEAGPILFGSETIDDKYLYWVDQSDQYSLRRAPKTGGGSTEIFWTAGLGATISQLAIDDCSVYWTTGLPDRLLMRAR
jgi:hypothetical protein